MVATSVALVVRSGRRDPMLAVVPPSLFAASPPPSPSPPAIPPAHFPPRVILRFGPDAAILRASPATPFDIDLLASAPEVAVPDWLRSQWRRSQVGNHSELHISVEAVDDPPDGWPLLSRVELARVCDDGDELAPTTAGLAALTQADRTACGFIGLDAGAGEALAGELVFDGSLVQVPLNGSAAIFRVVLAKGGFTMGRLAATTTVELVPHRPGDGVQFSHATEFVGYERDVSDLAATVEMCLVHDRLYETFRIPPQRGALVSGAMGVGKSFFVRHVLANVSRCLFTTISALDLIRLAAHDDPPTALPDYLQAVFQRVVAAAPCALVIEDMDLLCDDFTGIDFDHTTVTQPLQDALTWLLATSNPAGVCVVGVCSRPEKLPANLAPSLREGSLFSRELKLHAPKISERVAMVKAFSMRMASDDLVRRVGEESSGFVARDLQVLVEYAQIFADLRAQRQQERHQQHPAEHQMQLEARMQSLSLDGDADRLRPVAPGEDGDAAVLRLTWADFEMAFGKVKPAQAAGSGFETKKPKVAWDEVGGYDDVKTKLKHILRLHAPSDSDEADTTASRVGVKPPPGVLLCGPSGCGKTMLARAMASNAAGFNYIAVKGSDIFSKYLGDSEAAIRRLFATARQLRPCILFFDDIDTIGTKRNLESGGGGGGDGDGDGGGDGTGVGERVLSTLLNEMDGVTEQRRGVLVVATSRAPWALDAALVRPGRLEQVVHVPPPRSAGEREAVMRAVAPGLVDEEGDDDDGTQDDDGDEMYEDVEDDDEDEVGEVVGPGRVRPLARGPRSYAEAAAMTEGFTPADLTVLMREAGLLAVMEEERETLAVMMTATGAAAQERRVGSSGAGAGDGGERAVQGWEGEVGGENEGPTGRRGFGWVHVRHALAGILDEGDMERAFRASSSMLRADKKRKAGGAKGTAAVGGKERGPGGRQAGGSETSAGAGAGGGGTGEAAAAAAAGWGAEGGGMKSAGEWRWWQKGGGGRRAAEEAARFDAFLGGRRRQ
ncbi:P-loop containing nucleoside triphosphate hydrolase protein [Zopfochytrium polystomum]|nr:P-loop containing nucleoside triphosphate hydrolase protein [Zopfochytrium polystomum]